MTDSAIRQKAEEILLDKQLTWEIVQLFLDRNNFKLTSCDDSQTTSQFPIPIIYPQETTRLL